MRAYEIGSEVQDDFDLNVALANLSYLSPEKVASLPLNELEWILADYVVSWGQRLALEPNSQYKKSEQDKLHRFAQLWWPFYIASDFPKVDEEQIRTLALVITCFNLYMLLQDHIIDHPKTAKPEIKIAIPFVLERWFQLSNLLFPGDSLYWKEVHRIMTSTAQSMLTESRYKLIQPMSLDEYLETGRGRIAFTQLNAIGLAILNGHPEQIPELCEFWTAISLAALIHDDIADWMEDYCNQSYTYLHTQILFSPLFKGDTEAGRLPRLEEVGIALFYSNSAELLYEIAKEKLICAKSLASKNHYLKLIELSERGCNLLEERRNNLRIRKICSLLKMILEGKRI